MNPTNTNLTEMLGNVDILPKSSRRFRANLFSTLPHNKYTHILYIFSFHIFYSPFYFFQLIVKAPEKSNIRFKIVIKVPPSIEAVVDNWQLFTVITSRSVLSSACRCPFMKRYFEKIQFSAQHTFNLHCFGKILVRRYWYISYWCKKIARKIYIFFSKNEANVSTLNWQLMLWLLQRLVDVPLVGYALISFDQNCWQIRLFLVYFCIQILLEQLFRVLTTLK